MTADTALRPRSECSPYTPEMLETFRSRLLAQRGQILRKCEGLAEGNDVSDDAADQDRSKEFLGMAQVELKEITQALDRIDRRSFGVCEDCGDPIPEDRLEATPTACYCAPCQARSEGP